MTLDFGTDDQLRHAAHQYRLELGWTTTVSGDQLALELDDDIWGLQMPTPLAVALVAELALPVVDLPDQRSVVLIEPAERVETALPGRLPAGCRVPLPPSRTVRGPVRWLTHEPDGSQRASVGEVTDALARLMPPARGR